MTQNGIGTCLLGYGVYDVDKAVKKVISAGTMCTLNTPDDVELADLLLQIHQSIKANTVKNLLRGPVANVGFARLN